MNASIAYDRARAAVSALFAADGATLAETLSLLGEVRRLTDDYIEAVEADIAAYKKPAHD